MPDSHGNEFVQALDRYEVLQEIFDSIQDGILVVDEDENIVYANASAGRLLGTPREKLQKIRAEDLPVTMYSRGGKEMPEEDWPFAVSLRSNPLGKPQQVILKRPDGSTLPVLFNIRRKEDRLTVAILTDSSDMMRRQIQADEHYRLLAHDLRTPLAVILGHAEILQASPKDNVELLDKSVRAVHEAGKQLEALTEEMGDRLELESGHFELKSREIKLENLLLEVVSSFTYESTKRQVRVDVPTLSFVNADPHRLKRVLTNLISNAIKFSPEDSSIHVSAWENPVGIITKVSDQGRGIAAEDLHYLFDPFYIASTGKSQKGIGLGLYIARLIMEAHGGRIYVSSSEEGTSFVIFLPKASVLP